MNFKELLEQYKNGNLTDDERTYVENEIEKNESINEFLADEIDLNLNINNTNLKDNEIDSRKIKEAVNKRLRKVAVISALTVFIIMFAAKYIISPIVDSFYYNPNKISIGQYNSDFFFDMRNYIELYLPGYTLNFSHAEPLGFGKYDLYIHQRNLFKGSTEYTDISMIRNKPQGNFDSLLSKHLFLKPYDTPKVKEWERETTKKSLDYLKDLPSTSYVAAFVDFKKDLSIEELLLLQNTFDNPKTSHKMLDFRWVAIRVTSEENYKGIQVGFNPNRQYVISTNDNADSEKYPYLALEDYYSGSRTISTSFEKEMELLYETHFKSLLKYLYDRKDFAEALNLRYKQKDFYKPSLDYIEKNGVKTYGVLVYGEAKDIISFMENDITDCLYISDIKVSKFSK